eukprot:TRINITY_DN1502_c0_g1_i1.p1 TRINITY_DN1502_c0_g1~~TRINITY_DN1502_c0_g1_i1.p1  ORF type:complete len:645 (-),score=99.14 TRINITY_DN1502_c0_g1_i1:105-1985(-)
MPKTFPLRQVLAVGLACLTLYLLFFSIVLHYPHRIPSTLRDDYYISPSPPPLLTKSILFFTYPDSWANFHQPDIEEPNYLGDNITWQCDINCEFTSDYSRLKEVDGLLIEPLIPHYEPWRQEALMLPQKLPHQKWVVLSFETPRYYITQRYLWWFADLNMTYEQNSQIPVSFICSWGGGTLDDLRLPPPQKPKELASVVWIASNCGAGGSKFRQNYIRTLMKYIPVDSYGQCLHNKDLPPEWDFPIYQNHGMSMRIKINIFRKYKFVLTFENTNLTDYVTEKLMTALQGGAIPVYWGAPNIHEYLPGDHSVIRVDQFPNPRDLAKYLERVSTDQDLYNLHFEWKKRPFSPSFLDKYKKCIFYGGRCRLCKALASYHPLRTDFSPDLIQKFEDPVGGAFKGARFALDFAGNGSISLGKDTRFNLYKQFTLTAWIRPDSFADYRIIDKTEVDVLNGYLFDVLEVNGRPYLRLCTSECYLSLHALTTGWQFVAVTFNYNTRRGSFYLNGVFDNYFKIFDPTPLNDYPLFLANSPSQEKGWVGSLDEISIWHNVLSAKEIKDMMYNQLRGDERGLIAYYLFDEGQGNLIHDSSVNEIDGVLVNGEWRECFDKPFFISNYEKDSPEIDLHY